MPGTGKTHVIHTKVRKWKRKGARIFFLGPTGQLASRIRSEHPDIDVDTCHGGLLCAGDPIVGISFWQRVGEPRSRICRSCRKAWGVTWGITRCHRHPYTSPSYRLPRNTQHKDCQNGDRNQACTGGGHRSTVVSTVEEENSSNHGSHKTHAQCDRGPRQRGAVSRLPCGR